MKTIKLYGKYGELAHEYTPIWSDIEQEEPCVHGLFEIPEQVQTLESDIETLYKMPNGFTYSLREILTNGKGDKPYFRYYDDSCQKEIWIKLKEI